MRILGLVGCLAILGAGVGIGCGDDKKGGGDGGPSTGGAGGSAAAGGTSGGGSTGTGGSGAGGTSGGGASTFACDYANYSGTGFHWCWTWDASKLPSPAQVIGAYQMACSQGGGTAVTTCSTSGAVGKCTFTTATGTYTVSQTIFYYAPLDRATAMMACTAQGAGGTTATWTPL